MEGQNTIYLNISYDLWSIWYDYLEEQGQNTELLRYVLTYNVIGIGKMASIFKDVIGINEVLNIGNGYMPINNLICGEPIGNRFYLGCPYPYFILEGDGSLYGYY